jgi:membrane-associated protease RseP (regulator of RpoE activity)
MALSESDQALLQNGLLGWLKHSIETALSGTSQSGRIDLVHDLASATVYDVLVKLYGTPGPDWLTELAVSLPFSHQHIGELQPDWLKAAQAGTLVFVGYLALISISLGVLNLLPVPLLDGGHLLYYFAEIVKGSPVSDRAFEVGQRIGMAMLAVLMALALFNDLSRLF